MSIKKHKDSHLDHSLTPAQVEFILGLNAKEGELTIQTVELPEELGTVPCGLYGPCMGDEPIADDEVVMEVRGNRAGPSRLIERPTRPTRQLTVISGPHDGEPCVLFTSFGGPQAPREPFEDDSEESLAFWKEHALAK
jgi:hypothetical protein